MAKDVDLFRAAMIDVAPLKGRRSRALPKPKVAEAGKPLERPGPAPGPTIVPTPRDEPLSFDRDIDRALSRGKRSPEATLDLHGMTLAAAERAVSRFLEEAVALDLRVVLIVTGKGLREEGGRLMGGRIRSEFPVWLSHAGNRARVRGLRPAHPRHGGSGAFYVLLRRRSSASSRSLRATPQR
jgi:DNA-nicking Smr family endonuclease